MTAMYCEDQARADAALESAPVGPCVIYASTGRVVLVVGPCEYTARRTEWQVNAWLDEFSRISPAEVLPLPQPKSWRWFDVFRATRHPVCPSTPKPTAFGQLRILRHVPDLVRRRQKRRYFLQRLRVAA